MKPKVDNRRDHAGGRVAPDPDARAINIEFNHTRASRDRSALRRQSNRHFLSSLHDNRRK